MNAMKSLTPISAEGSSATFMYLEPLPHTSLSAASRCISAMSRTSVTFHISWWRSSCAPLPSSIRPMSPCQPVFCDAPSSGPSTWQGLDVTTSIPFSSPHS